VTLFAFYGTFMRNEPGHGNLARARFIESTRTAPRYRLYHVDGRWPALVPSEDGVEVVCELYEAPEDLLAELAAIEPSGWSRAPLKLASGRVVEGFLGDAALALQGVDVSAHGGWAAYVRSVAYQTTSEPCQNAVPR
jgi:allophanate hydrolase